MPTTPNGLRYPGAPDSEPPNGPLQIGNLALDADTKIIGRFASLAALNTAYPTPVNGMLAWASAQQSWYGAQGGVWKWTNLGQESLFSRGAGGSFNITTTPSYPTGGAQLSLTAGTYDFDIEARFILSVSTVGRVFTLHMFAGGTSQFFTAFSVNTTGGDTSRNAAGFDRITLATATTVQIRVSANAVGGTQNVTSNKLRATRVA